MDDNTQTTGQVDAPTNVDTAPAQASEADVQTNNQTPEAAPAQEAEVNATDTVEEKLYAGKYKDVEALEKSYKELESKYGQTASEKAELTRLLTEAFTTPEPQAQIPEVDPYDDTPQINNETEGIKKDLAITKFIIAHPDADANAMKEVLTSDPFINQIQGHDAKLEYALLKSQNMGHKKAIVEAQNKAVQETKQKVVEKQTAQVESAQKSDTVDEKSELKQRMNSGNYEERDSARREYIRKYLVDI